MQGGDLIFVRPAADDWAGQLVARATGGPYCHVRVCISGGEVVEALTSGIQRDLIGAGVDVADVASTGARLAVDRRAHALRWLLAQLTDGYGWLDIAADIAQMLLPRRLGSRTPFLVSPRQYDCADVAVRFLALAGYKWLPDELVMAPQRVSPNDLARALGILADEQQQEVAAS